MVHKKHFNQLICGALISLFFPMSSWAADRLTCVAWLVNEEHDIMKRGFLVPQSYDKNYLEISIEDFVYGALIYDVDKNNIILTATETKTNRTALMSGGFSPIADSPVRIAEQKFVIRNPDKSTTWLTTSCYTEPASEKSRVPALVEKNESEMRARHARISRKLLR